MNYEKTIFINEQVANIYNLLLNMSKEEIANKFNYKESKHMHLANICFENERCLTLEVVICFQGPNKSHIAITLNKNNGYTIMRSNNYNNTVFGTYVVTNEDDLYTIIIEPSVILILNVTVERMGTYNSSVQVPKNLSLKDAIEYAKEHLDEISVGELSSVGNDNKINEEKCYFREYKEHSISALEYI